MMKILNLYAGIGGNRKLWGDEHEVTAVELIPEIAAFYQRQYPKDIVIIEDAHNYLLYNFKNFDMIWSSIECTSHSRARYWASKGGRYDPVYPDLKLYEEVIFLDKFFDGYWVVENVIPYYKELIRPIRRLGRHSFWGNFEIEYSEFPRENVFDGNIEEWQDKFNIDISGHEFKIRKDKILRNCVHPEMGKHVLDCMIKSKKRGSINFEQQTIEF